jgi:hypothetical protein
MLIIARRQQRDRALVIRGGTRPVNLLMELRKCGENEREEDSDDASRDHNRPECGSFAVSEAKAHQARVCFVESLSASAI